MIWLRYGANLLSFKDNSINEATANAQEDRSVRGEQTAENIRYGQAISESGFGGETVAFSGSAQQSGYGRTEGIEKDGHVGQTRREQGYGEGNNVGAWLRAAESISQGQIYNKKTTITE